jgi:Holliday junction resolvase
MRTVGAKRDANEKEIIKALRDYGCVVVQLPSSDSLGIPDLLVSLSDGRLILMEVKMPKGKLRKSQEKFFTMFNKSPVFMVTSPEDALQCIYSEERHGSKED